MFRVLFLRITFRPITPVYLCLLTGQNAVPLFVQIINALDAVIDHHSFSPVSFKRHSVKPEGIEGMVIKAMYLGLATD